MLLFTFTVVGKKFSIPCPLPGPGNSTNMTESVHSSPVDEEEEPQFCEPKMVHFNARVRTLLCFSV